jgi:hypothetical protein
VADEAPVARHDLTITVGGCRDGRYRAVCSCGWERAGRTNTDASLLFGQHLLAQAKASEERPPSYDRMSHYLGVATCACGWTGTSSEAQGHLLSEHAKASEVAPGGDS